MHAFRLETCTAAWATGHTARVAVLEAAVKVFHSDPPISSNFKSAQFGAKNFILRARRELLLFEHSG